MNLTPAEAFQMGRAILLQEQINTRMNCHIAVERIKSLFVKHGIVGDYTLWEREDRVLKDLGYEYDEIWEVA